MKRNTAADVAKGIAIALMVIGHCYCKENVVLKMIYAFHMPFFFVMSGFLYAEKWRDTVKINFGRSCAKLLIPYVVFELLFVVFLTVLQRPENLVGQILNTFATRVLTLEGYSVSWFLPCQLLVAVLAALIVRLTKAKRRWLGASVFTVIFMVGLFAPLPTRYLTTLWRVFIGMGFFAVGYYAEPLIKKKAKLWILLPTAVAFVTLALLNDMPSLVSLDFANPALYVINGILGSYLLLQICLRIKENRLSKGIANLGKNTVIILCTHMFVVEIVRLLDYKLFNNALPRLGIFEGFVFGGIVIAVMCGVIPLCNRFFWYLFGNFRRKA